MRIATLAMAALMMAAPAAAAAQPAPANGARADGDIIVEGRKGEKSRVRRFVDTLTPMHMDLQIGRFAEPVCPYVTGFAAHENAAIAARYRQVAKAAGIAVARANCDANVLVMAVTDKRVFVESIPKFTPALAYGVKRDRLAKIANAPVPVASWQVERLLDENGQPPIGLRLNSEDMQSTVPMTTTADASRILRSAQKSVTTAVLLIERRALKQITTRQLADFAVMRTLAPIDPLSYRHALAGNPQALLPAPSILTLFDGGSTGADQAPSVTWWDFAFLQALYDITMTRSALSQRSEIERRMAKLLAAVPAEDF